jgi:hypothetical protein
MYLICGVESIVSNMIFEARLKYLIKLEYSVCARRLSAHLISVLALSNTEHGTLLQITQPLSSLYFSDKSVLRAREKYILLRSIKRAFPVDMKNEILKSAKPTSLEILACFLNLYSSKTLAA